MPIVFDPNKKLIGIEVMYIEKVRKNGNITYQFIQDKDEYDNLIKNGFKVFQETNNNIQLGQQPQDIPGAPKQTVEDKFIYKITTHWKKLTWKDNMSILSKCYRVKVSGTGKQEMEIDHILYRELKFKTCLVRWDIKDENNVPVEVNATNIDNLPPEIGNELINSFEQATEASEDDIKN